MAAEVERCCLFSNQLIMQLMTPRTAFSSFSYDDHLKKHGSLLREFGNAIKSASTVSIKRIFMTGVAPVTFCDANTSINTIRNLTDLPAFQGAFGMTASDVEGFLRVICKDHCGDNDAQIAEHLETMRLNFGGYRALPDQKESTFNPQAVWHYLKELRKEGKKPLCLVDPTIAQVADAESMASYLVSVVKKGSSTHQSGGVFQCRELEPHFRAAKLFKPSTAYSALLSLAYYHGYLTYADPFLEHRGKLVAPNDQMRKVFTDKVLDGLKP